MKLKIKFILKFNWENFVIFWILFNLFFSLNDFIWNFYKFKKFEIESLFFSIILNVLNPLNFVERIKKAIENPNYIITIFFIFFISFIISFVRTKIKKCQKK